MKATVTKVEKRITVKDRRYEGVVGFDIDNDYPNRVRDIVANSGMGKSCLNLYRKFIVGKGFKNETFANMKLNRWNDSSDKILAMVADNFAYFGGYCLHINYSANYKISDISFQPLAQVRKTTGEHDDYPNMFAVYKDWGAKQIKKDQIKYIDKFNPDPTVIAQQVEKAGSWANYRGQIYYFSNEQDCYPLPVFDAVLEDMQTDSQAKTYKFRNVTTNFMASHMLITDAIESDDSESNKGEKNNLIKSLEEYQGADNAQKIILVEKTSPDQTFELKKIEQQDGDKLYEWTEASTRDNIRQAMFIPAILLTQGVSKLGADDIIDATKYYNSITEDERTQISNTFLELSQYTEKNIGTTFDDFLIEPREAIRKEDVPAEILPDLTKNERRAMVGYKEIEDANTQTLAEKLQVGGTQSMISVLTNPDMTDDEKRGALEVLFGLDQAQITKLIPQKDAANAGAVTTV